MRAGPAFLQFDWSKAGLSMDLPVFVYSHTKTSFRFLSRLRKYSKVGPYLRTLVLLYEKQTRLINSLLDGQEVRNGKPSLKSFCDLGLKLESCWVTHRHRPDDVDRFLHL